MALVTPILVEYLHLLNYLHHDDLTPWHLHSLLNVFLTDTLPACMECIVIVTFRNQMINTTTVTVT